MTKLQHYVGSLFYLAGLLMVFFGTELGGDFAQLPTCIVTGAALVLVGYCIQGFHWPPSGR